MLWWSKKERQPVEPAGAGEDRIRRRYLSFRELLSLNNECLELMSGIQEDLQFVWPNREIVGTRVAAVYEKAEATVAALERLSGLSYASLHESLRSQRNEVERHVAALEELAFPDFSHSLAEVDQSKLREVGGKARPLA